MEVILPPLRRDGTYPNLELLVFGGDGPSCGEFCTLGLDNTVGLAIGGAAALSLLIAGLAYVFARAIPYQPELVRELPQPFGRPRRPAVGGRSYVSPYEARLDGGLDRVAKEVEATGGLAIGGPVNLELYKMQALAQEEQERMGPSRPGTNASTAPLTRAPAPYDAPKPEPFYPPPLSRAQSLAAASNRTDSVAAPSVVSRPSIRSVRSARPYSSVSRLVPGLS